MSKKLEMPMINTGRIQVDMIIRRTGPKKGVKLLPSGKVDTEYMRKKDNELVTGTFRFHEMPGGVLTFPFYKYKNDPVETYMLIDGQVYTLPRMVKNHINNNLRIPVYSYIPGESGVQEVKTHFTGGLSCKITTWKPRCSFVTVDNDDDFEGSEPNIAVVEQIPS